MDLTCIGLETGVGHMDVSSNRRAELSCNSHPDSQKDRAAEAHSTHLDVFQSTIGKDHGSCLLCVRAVIFICSAQSLKATKG